MRKMYRIDRMRKDYERFTAAEGYIIGFPYNGIAYGIQLDKIPRRLTRVQKECSACGVGCQTEILWNRVDGQGCGD